jgi:hypothetical protein
MKEMNCRFEDGQVTQAWSVGAMVLFMLALAVVAAFSSGCTRDVYVDPSFVDDASADNGEDNTYNPPNNEADVAEDTADVGEGDCSGPWGCKSYSDTKPLPAECEDDDGCAEGFVCSDGQCVPAGEEDTSEDVGGEVEQTHYPLTTPDAQSETEELECHCGVGYICEDGFCVKVGGNDNPPSNNEEDAEQPEPDVVEQDVAPESTEDVVAQDSSIGADSSPEATGDAAPQQAEDVVADSATDNSAEQSTTDVVADESSVDQVGEGSFDSADSAQDDKGELNPEVATEPFVGAKCTITCLPQYEKVRVWWAFTSADVANGSSFKIPKAELCLWGQMAFEFNCFTPDGPWGDYLKATVSCQPDDYELEDTGVHGKVVFAESCW